MLGVEFIKTVTRSPLTNLVQQYTPSLTQLQRRLRHRRRATPIIHMPRQTHQRRRKQRRLHRHTQRPQLSPRRPLNRPLLHATP